MPPKFKKIASDVSGQVLWFKKQEGYGKVNFEDYGDVFVHHSRILSPVNKSGNNFLLPSQIVKCDILSGPKGNQADNVTVIYSKPNQRSSSTSSKDRQQRAASESSYGSKAQYRGSDSTPNASSCTIIEKDLRGEVTSFDCNQGHGYILIRQYGSIVCHSDNIMFAGLSAREHSLQPTQIVKCDVGRDRKGVLVALNIHVICEASNVTVAGKRSATADQPLASGQKNAPVQSDSDEDSEKSCGIIANDCLGEVTMYNPTKMFGFIRVQGYDNVYVRSYALMKTNTLRPKQIVKCDVTRGPKSLMALNVRVLSDSAETPTTTQSSTNQKTKSKSQEKILPLMNESSSTPSKPIHLLASAPPTAPLPPPINSMPTYPTHPLMGQNYGVVHPNQFLPPSMQQFPGCPYLLENPPPYQSGAPLDLEKLKLSDELHRTRNTETNEKKKMKKRAQDNTRSNKTVTEKGDKSEKCKLLCEICEDRLEDPVSVPCGHLFCRECINEWLAVNPSCPVDGKAISKKSVKQASQEIRNNLK